MEKISVKDFVDKYVNCVKMSKETYLEQELTIIPYISIVEKIELCKRIIESTSYHYIKNDDGDVTKTTDILVNSPIRSVLFTMNIVDNWTNIKVDFSNVMEEYDLLMSNGLIGIITKKIPDSEVVEFNSLFQMTAEDKITNELNTAAFISSQLNKFSLVLDNNLSPILDNILNKLHNISDEDMDKIMEKFNKHFDKTLNRLTK